VASSQLLVAVSVYVVEDDGETLILPETGFTEPILWLMLAEVASAIDQLRVASCTDLIYY
jgi:hypothetical protein